MIASVDGQIPFPDLLGKCSFFFTSSQQLSGHGGTKNAEMHSHMGYLGAEIEVASWLFGALTSSICTEMSHYMIGNFCDWKPIEALKSWHLEQKPSVFSV